MLPKSCRVKAAMMICDLWYQYRNRDIRRLTTRIESLWFEVDFLVEQMEIAEETWEDFDATRYLDCILYNLHCIQREARAVCA